MKVHSLFCGVSYSNFALFDPAVFAWDDLSAHMITNNSLNQGFAWRPGHVEFYTVNADDFGGFNCPYDMFGIELDIRLDEPVKLSSDAVRAIQVPFSVAGNDGIRITDDGDYVARPPRKIAIPAGDYAFVFEQGWKYDPQPIEINEATGEDEMEFLYTLWGRLWFTPEQNAEPKIILQDPRDERMRPTSPLCMNGVPG